EVLYRKWRPRALDEVVGQATVTNTLKNAVTSGRLTHAYLFCGPRGTGKTSTARILAKAVNCLDPQNGEPDNACENCLAVIEGRALDLIEIDAASNRGIDDIRDLSDRIGFAPTQSQYKVYIVDEVHMLTDAAFNALLKTLEEPPGHAIFILATTEVHKVPLTVVSRCQRYDFRRIPIEAMHQKLAQLSAAEGVEAEAEALDLIARHSTGSLRDAENA
ncbi:DNA polymerase III subunit gamma/tau, partial [Geodia barretti]